MAVQKQYNIKVYNLSGVYQKTLSQNIIMSDISFSSQIEWGQWQLSISLAVSVDSAIVSYNNIIKVYETDENNDTAILVYSGIVTQITRVSDAGREYIDITILGLATMLTQNYFYDGSYSFSKNQEASETIKDIIDSFSTIYPWILSYDANSIENTGVTANFTFEYSKHNDAIKKVRDIANNWWYVDETGKVHYHPKTGGIWQVTHILTSGKDIESITIEEDSENIVNKYFLTWSGGTVTAQDTTSQTAYGIKELRESNTDIWDITTANSFASRYISANKDPKKRIKIVVNTRYNIESIKPWHLVTVKNYDYQISSLQIAKIEYNSQKITLELEQITSFAQEISKI